MLISGGFAVQKQARLLQKKPDILISTIGRLWDLIQTNQHDSLNTLAQCDFLVFDEVDRILELGQFKELSHILNFLENP